LNDLAKLGSVESKRPPTNQHYVPQFLLRNFASGRSRKGNEIFVFDKANERSFPESTKRVASAKAFYDFAVDGAVRSIDPLLTKMESEVSGIITKIIQTRSLRGLSAKERTMVALFATVQMLRTDARRKQLKNLSDAVSDAVKQIGGDPNKVEGFDFLNEEQARMYSIESIPELARDLTPHLLSKSWILYSTPQRLPFYISDNPVSLHNTMNQDPILGTLGLDVSGIEIYLPLSATLCLVFLCPTIETTISESHQMAMRLGHLVPPHVQELISALDGDMTLDLDSDNVTHHNSLQVINAERFVFSCSDDFSLVREMLRRYPELKCGQRYG
jgi:hypothetical protein